MGTERRRQVNLKYAPLSGNAIDTYAAAMGQSDMLDYGQAQPCPALFAAAALVGAVETLKKTRQVVFFDSAAMVPHCQYYAIIATVAGDLNGLPVLAVFDSVVDQIHHSLFQ